MPSSSPMSHFCIDFRTASMQSPHTYCTACDSILSQAACLYSTKLWRPGGSGICRARFHSIALRKRTKLFLSPESRQLERKLTHWCLQLWISSARIGSGRVATKATSYQAIGQICVNGLTISAYLVLRVPPSDKINEVSPSLAPGGLLRSLTGVVLSPLYWLYGLIGEE